jgi:hypothetical protein
MANMPGSLVLPIGKRCRKVVHATLTTRASHTTRHQIPVDQTDTIFFQIGLAAQKGSQATSHA